MSNDSFDFEFELNIVTWPDGLKEEIEEAVEGMDVDVMIGSAFSGADVMTLLGKMSDPLLNALTNVFKIRMEEDKEKHIVVQSGEDRVEVKGYSQEEFAAAREDLLEMLKQVKSE